MYVVTVPTRLAKDEQLAALEQETSVALPAAYRRFLLQYGGGTYRNWLYVKQPDPDVLKPFVEYAFWEHEETSPIQLEQLASCVVLMSTIDGDFIAVHPGVNGLIWLPRHADEIGHWPLLEDGNWTDVMDQIIQQQTGQAVEDKAVFEPECETQHVVFLHLQDGGVLALQQLAQRCRDAFGAFDLEISNPYTGRQYVQRMGGWIRYNYAYGKEVAVCYERKQEQVAERIVHWLEEQGCRKLEAT